MLTVALIAAATTACSVVPVRKTVPTDRKLAQKDWDEPEVYPIYINGHLIQKVSFSLVLLSPMVGTGSGSGSGSGSYSSFSIL